MRYTGKQGIPAGTGAKRIVRTFYANTSTAMAEGIEPTPACAGEPHAGTSILCFKENVEKKISRAGTRRTAPGGSQGIVNKGLLTYRRWRDRLSGRRRTLHPPMFSTGFG